MISADGARKLADEVLFPAADAVDAAGEVPASHFDLLAEAGFYGAAAPAAAGGPDLPMAELARIAEELAGGCLATAFTWIQHHGLVRALAHTGRAELREHYLADAVRGRIRGGSAFAGALPQPPLLHATPVDGGYRLDGHAPFVSGWGVIDLIQVSARHGDELVNGLLDARPGAGLTARRLELIAGQGTRTVRLDFDGFFLPDERVPAVLPHAEFLAGLGPSTRLNGMLALGVAGRCARLLGERGRDELAAGITAEQDALRARLVDPASPDEEVSAARAGASELAHRAAGALVTATGSGALHTGSTASRLAREALFTLVAAGRPEIRAGLLGLLGTPPCAG